MKLIKPLIFVLVTCVALYSCKSDDDFDIKVTDIKITTHDFTLTEVGESKTLEWTITPSDATNKKVSWLSRNINVANVDQNGKVTAVANGNTYVVVNATDGNKRDSVYVTVNITPAAPTLTIEIPTNPTIVKGETLTLSYVAVPEISNDKVLWKSRNTSYATVSTTGVVTAVEAGSTYIVVAHTESELKDSVEITVVEQVISVTDINIQEDDFSINRGETKQLSYTITPSNATNGNVTWKSSTPDVASVSSTGLVTAISVGSTYIITLTEDVNVKDSIKVTVINPEIPVTSISINEADFSIDKGETRQLTYTITPSDATNTNVIWESTNTNAVSVSSSGLITAVNAGTANIIVTAENTTIKDEIEITVVEPTIPVTGVNISPTEFSMFAGYTKQLNYEVTPSDATNQNVQWSSNNPGVATVDNNGLVTPIADGDAIITVTTEEGNKQASANFIVASNISGTYPGILEGSTKEILGIAPQEVEQEGEMIATHNSSTSATLRIDQTIEGIPIQEDIDCAIAYSISNCTLSGEKEAVVTVPANEYGVPAGNYDVRVILDGTIDAEGNARINVKVKIKLLIFWTDAFEGIFTGMKQ
ncbi:MAG: Ig-like domain-containing protein [Prevotellaceae bacterium]|jgi:uncharacterized protein YjdB|nr:Ig-like domain-containing protein [Prevotellaceae bacterium]